MFLDGQAGTDESRTEINERHIHTYIPRPFLLICLPTIRDMPTGGSEPFREPLKRENNERNEPNASLQHNFFDQKKNTNKPKTKRPPVVGPPKPSRTKLIAFLPSEAQAYFSASRQGEKFLRTFSTVSAPSSSTQPRENPSSPPAHIGSGHPCRKRQCQQLNNLAHEVTITSNYVLGRANYHLIAAACAGVLSPHAGVLLVNT